MFRSLLTSIVADSAVNAAAFYPRATAPTVNTTYGLVQGVTSEYVDGVAVYKGIPYASAPTGSLRWKPPQNASAWSGTLNATSYGADCAQSYSSAGIFSSGSTDISEDCLFMNIWTPANATSTSNLPVYFWIYGDIVVVNINYRMGPFGFLAHPDLSAESGHNSSGNYGILDMQFALNWVKDNIAAFGRDGTHITTGGQSAGSASSLDMMYSPLSRDLIVGAIAESSARAPHDPMTYQLATSHRTRVAAEAEGVTFLAEMNVTTIDQLRNVSMDTLLTYDSASDTILEGTAFENVTAFMEPPLWRPVIDGYVLTHNYGEALSLGAHADVPILTGNNADESGASLDPGLTLDTFTTQYTEMFGNLSSTFFELYPANTTSAANNASNDMFRDLSRVSTWQWAKEWYAGGATSNVYTYYFNHAPPNQTSGVYHGAELWYAFNNIPYSGVAVYDGGDPWTTQDYAIADTLSQYWANFIKTGNPNDGNLTQFPASSSNVSQTMWLGESFGAAGTAASTENQDFIEEFFSQQIQW